MGAERSVPWIDAEALLDAAQQKCGLREFEDPTFPARLQRFVEVLNGGQFSLEARDQVIDQVSDTLVARLQIADARMRNPAVSTERIEQPLMVTGLPRSGTTLLHSLLVEDPANRGPRLAEILDPTLPTELDSAEPARLRELDLRNERFLEAIPRMIQAHPYLDMGARSLMECESWPALDFRNTYPNLFHRAQKSLEVLTDDPPGHYAFHRAFLQHRQHGAAPRRWALKGTEHQYNLEVVRDVYPDARVLWIHRDPLKVVPSYFELIAMMSEALVGPVDRPALAAEMLPATAARIDALLSDPLLDADFVCHVDYLDFMRDPSRAIREIYGRFEIPFSPSFAERLGAWAGENALTRHGKWEYAMEDFGISAADVEKHFANYRERFGIPTEDR
ncbi:MAG: sulfotransferase [Myxococcota bacterium]